MEGKTHEIPVDARWLGHIREGRKTVEGKKQTPKWLEIRRGDMIQFTCKDEAPVIVRVTAIRFFFEPRDTLGAFLRAESLVQTLPGVETMDEARAIYNGFLGQEEIQKLGLMAIHFEKK